MESKNDHDAIRNDKLKELNEIRPLSEQLAMMLADKSDDRTDPEKKRIIN